MARLKEPGQLVWVTSEFWGGTISPPSPLPLLLIPNPLPPPLLPLLPEQLKHTPPPSTPAVAPVPSSPARPPRPFEPQLEHQITATSVIVTMNPALTAERLRSAWSNCMVSSL